MQTQSSEHCSLFKFTSDRDHSLKRRIVLIDRRQASQIKPRQNNIFEGNYIFIDKLAKQSNLDSDNQQNQRQEAGKGRKQKSIPMLKQGRSQSQMRQTKLQKLHQKFQKHKRQSQLFFDKIKSRVKKSRFQESVMGREKQFVQKLNKSKLLWFKKPDHERQLGCYFQYTLRNRRLEDDPFYKHKQQITHRMRLWNEKQNRDYLQLRGRNKRFSQYSQLT